VQGLHCLVWCNRDPIVGRASEPSAGGGTASANRITGAVIGAISNGGGGGGRVLRKLSHKGSYDGGGSNRFKGISIGRAFMPAVDKQHGGSASVPSPTCKKILIDSDTSVLKSVW